jgi:hypothetical protein
MTYEFHVGTNYLANNQTTNYKFSWRNELTRQQTKQKQANKLAIKQKKTDLN